MSALLIMVVVLTAVGVAMIGLMFRSDNTRIGLAGIIVLLVASSAVMVYALGRE